MSEKKTVIEPLAPAVCSALASCPLLPCPECGSDGYVPHDAWDMVRCGNWNCRLHKMPNVLSREQWQTAPRGELVAYAKELERAALELEALQQTPEESQRVSDSGFSQFRRWKKETEEGRFAATLAKGNYDVKQAIVAAWVAGRESADSPSLELVRAIFEAGYRHGVNDTDLDLKFSDRVHEFAANAWHNAIAWRFLTDAEDCKLDAGNAKQWEDIR